ncbi:MAG: hypothetical protein M0Z53_16400 [Thermaerobacter sp.]|nr:hypothetical protein [Thermaerobacter sp.]
MIPILIDTHLGLAFALAVLSLWLTWNAYQRRKLPEHDVTPGYWKIQNVFQAGVLLQAALGIMLVIEHVTPKDRLHFIYGGVLLLIVLIQRAMRPGHPVRATITQDYRRFNEAWVLASLNFASFLMIGRAITTGIWGF